MTEKEILTLAQNAGFVAKIIPTQDIVVDYSFRKFCEDNLCGKFGANYSCPPDCGTPEELHSKILAKDNALVMQLICNIDGYEDKEAIQNARKNVNFSVLDVAENMREAGYNLIPLGYNGCPLCNPCKRTLNQSCLFPEKSISCISAYCINVTELANRCEFEFTWSDKKLYLFGMILFDNK